MDFAAFGLTDTQSDSMVKLFQVLEMQHKALEHLTKVVNKDMRDMDIALKGLSEESDFARSAQQRDRDMADK